MTIATLPCLRHFARPGDIYRCDVTFALADGERFQERRDLIVWEVTVDPDTDVETVTAQFATTAAHGMTDKPFGPVMRFTLDTYAAGTWEHGAIRGQFRERVSRYTALDPAANSVDIMADAARQQLARQARTAR